MADDHDAEGSAAMSPNRPMTRANVGPVLRIVLPVVAAFAWYLAYSWLVISPEELANSIALRTLDGYPSLDAWAAAMGVGALVMTVALVRHSKPLYVHAAALMLAVQLFLALTYAVAAVTGPTSSSAWAWPAVVATVCLACIKGLTSREA